MPPCIGKWLDDVIVGACVEAADAILFERSGSEKDDWGSFVVTSQLLADVEAVFAGKRHVEDDEVKRLLACAFGGLRSVADKFHVLTFDAERVLESARSLPHLRLRVFASFALHLRAQRTGRHVAA